MILQILTISEDKTIQLLTKILENMNAKPDSAIIGLGGMVLVAILSILTQIFITRYIIKADLRKIQTQIETEYNFRKKQEWNIQFRKIIADLVTETDPDRENEFNITKMISLINQSQLMLDSANSIEKEIFGLITHIGMIISEREEDKLYRERSGDRENISDYSSNIMKIQGEIVDKTRILLCSK